MPRKTKAQVEAELLAQQEGTVEDTPMAENPVPNDALIEGEMSPEVSDENNESSDTPEDVSPLESTPQVDMVSDSEPLKEESAISSAGSLGFSRRTISPPGSISRNRGEQTRGESDKTPAESNS